MKISNLNKIENFHFISDKYDDLDVKDGYTSDLLSDVMGNANPNTVLITIQAHKNTVAVARLIGINAIIICNDRKVEQDMIDAAANEKIALIKTSDNQFTASYKVADLLKK